VYSAHTSLSSQTQRRRQTRRPAPPLPTSPASPWAQRTRATSCRRRLDGPPWRLRRARQCWRRAPPQTFRYTSCASYRSSVRCWHRPGLPPRRRVCYQYSV